MPDKKIQKLPDKKIPNLPDKKIPNLPDKKIPNLPDKKILNLPDKKILNLPDKKIPNLPDKKIQKLPDKTIPNLPDKKIQKLPDKTIPNLPGKKIPNLVDKKIRIPNLQKKQMNGSFLHVWPSKQPWAGNPFGWVPSCTPGPHLRCPTFSWRNALAASIHQPRNGATASQQNDALRALRSIIQNKKLVRICEWL